MHGAALPNRNPHDVLARDAPQGTSEEALAYSGKTPGRRRGMTLTGHASVA